MYVPESHLYMYVQKCTTVTLDKFGVKKRKKQPKPTLQGIFELAYSFRDKCHQVSCQLHVNHLLTTLGLWFVLVTIFRVELEKS